MRSRRTWVLLAAMLTVPAACGGTDGWTPVLESAPPAYLEREVAAAAEEVREARRADGVGETGEAEAALASAERRLVGLAEVFLPLYRARIDATNAYRHHELGQTAQARLALERVSEAVAELSRRTEGSLAGELEQVSASVGRARVALEGDAPDAALHLERLAEQLADLVTRAGLIL